MSPALEAAPAALFAVDWGTSSCRTWALDASGAVVSSATSRDGSLAVASMAAADDSESRAASFENAFRRIAGDALDRSPGAPVLACGMVGSSFGWREAGYIELPTEITFPRDALTRTALADGRPLWIIPGLHSAGTAENEYPDVLRGEETQLIGVLSGLEDDGDHHAARVIVLPGTHSKWVRVTGETIDAFTTVMGGEMFNLLMEHSILGEPATADSPFDREDFLRGVDLGAHGTRSLLSSIFSSRGLMLDGMLRADRIGSYLSGLLIGDEIAHQLAHYRPAGELILCGAPALTRQYAIALEHFGIPSTIRGDDATLRGLVSIARSAELLPTAHDERTQQ